MKSQGIWIWILSGNPVRPVSEAELIGFCLVWSVTRKTGFFCDKTHMAFLLSCHLHDAPCHEYTCLPGFESFTCQTSLLRIDYM